MTASFLAIVQTLPRCEFLSRQTLASAVPTVSSPLFGQKAHTLRRHRQGCFEGALCINRLATSRERPKAKRRENSANATAQPIGAMSARTATHDSPAPFGSAQDRLRAGYVRPKKMQAPARTHLCKGSRRKAKSEERTASVTHSPFSSALISRFLMSRCR